MSDKAKIGIVLLVVVLVALPLAGKLMRKNAAQSATGNSGDTYNLVSVDGHPVPGLVVS